MNSKSNEQVNGLRAKIEDYYSTIQALHAFISLLIWDGDRIQDGAKFGIGRKMGTSSNNRVSPNTSVTPDATVQRFDNLGYVIEAKKSLPQNKEQWQKEVNQLLKYDDNLIGWWTDDQLIDQQCTVLLIEISRAVDFVDYLKLYLSENGIHFANEMSVIFFTRADEFKPHYMLRTEWGNIQDQYIFDLLRRGKKVTVEAVTASFGERKFYDSEPAPEFTMIVIWQDIFNHIARNYEFNRDIKAYIFDVDVTEITRELQQNYGSTGNSHRSVEFPKKIWVNKAFDGFVRLHLAEKLDNDKYRIYYKLIRTDLLEKFSKHQNGRQKSKGGIPPNKNKWNYLQNLSLLIKARKQVIYVTWAVGKLVF